MKRNKEKPQEGLILKDRGSVCYPRTLQRFSKYNGKLILGIDEGNSDNFKENLFSNEKTYVFYMFCPIAENYIGR